MVGSEMGKRFIINVMIYGMGCRVVVIYLVLYLGKKSDIRLIFGLETMPCRLLKIT